MPQNPQNKHLILINYLAPGQGTGSGIILSRHLSELSNKGWDVTICAPDADAAAREHQSSNWQAISIPSRLWWWPPYRAHSDLLEAIRAELLASMIKSELAKLGLPPASHVLTIPWGHYARAAARYAEKAKAKLVAIFHDQEEYWAKTDHAAAMARARTLAIFNQAEAVFAVSHELLAPYELKAPKGQVLRPIPGTQLYFPHNCSAFSPKPVIGHAGSIHEFQLENFTHLAEGLAKVGGKLLLVCEASNATHSALAAKFQNIVRVDRFEANEDAISYLSQNCSALLISYSFDLKKQGWAASSFPSKFLEYVRTGLPVLIMGPTNSAIGSWAQQNEWHLFQSDLDPNSLASKLAVLTAESTWMAEARRTEELAKTEFSASRIQAQLERTLK